MTTRNENEVNEMFLTTLSRAQCEKIHEAALGILEKHGWLVALESGAVVREAARKEAWRVVRRG